MAEGLAPPRTEGWGMALASGRRMELSRQEPSPPCPEPPRRDAGSGELRGLGLAPNVSACSDALHKGVIVPA